MKSPQVGRLTHVSATLLWPTDAAFAAWLGDNLEALAEATSLKLSQPQLMDGETAIVLAAQETGGSAVIVCQRAGSTDAAFGALARHLAASTARHAVWICGEPYEEHGAAVSWLNRAIDGRFVMVKVGAVTIGDSAAAPTFELVVRSPRADDAGVESTVPTASADASVSSRRAGDWLAGAGEDAQSG